MLQFHPLANILPLIEGPQFDELVVSIKERGQLDPIVIYEGAILDGRNRYRACLQAGVEPRTVEFNGAFPHLFVMDRNLHRRDLTPSQRALAIAMYAEFNNRGANQHTNGGWLPRPILKDHANKADISVASVKRARTVVNFGTPDEIAAVKNGHSLAGIARKVYARRQRQPKPPKPPKTPAPRKRGYITEKTRLAIFERGVNLFCNYAEALEELPTPKLTDEQRKEHLKQIKNAISLIWQFRKRIIGDTNG